MLDRAFIRPIAHRGLHRPDGGPLENTLSAAAAAIAGGFGIECDLQPAADGTPMVFHDATLERLTALTGPIKDRSPESLVRTTLSGSADHIPTFDELLALVAGRVPLLVEIKSNWSPLADAFLEGVARRALAYRGPIALMSFDPDVVVEMRRRCPLVPRGIVSGHYRNDDGEGWWGDVLSPDRQERLTHLLCSRDASPDFYAYHVKALPTPVTRYVREVQGLPLFTWTVRTAQDRATALAHADAAIFEGPAPASP